MSSLDTYESSGNPAPQDGDIIRCRYPAQRRDGFPVLGAIYHVDFVDRETGLLALSDRQDGQGKRLSAMYMAWRFSLLRRATAE